MRRGFIETHRQEYGVEPICNVLPIAPSTVRRHAARQADPRAIAYEKSGRRFDAEDPLLRAKERIDAGSSPFRHPRSELIAPLLQEAAPAFNNRKLHMRLPCQEAGEVLAGVKAVPICCGSDGC